MKLTEKEFKVLEFMIQRNCSIIKPFHPNYLTAVVFSEETIKKYSRARSRKATIDAMIASYLGKMCNKDLLRRDYERDSSYKGLYPTKLGKQLYQERLESLKNKND